MAGRIFFFFYGFLGVSAIGFFIVSLRNAVVEQFQWRLIDQFSRPAHMSRIQTRMSVKDLSYPMACLQEEERVKIMVKRKMIVRMIALWIVFWFGGAGVFCAFEEWTYLESLYFCVSLSGFFLVDLHCLFSARPPLFVPHLTGNLIV